MHRHALVNAFGHVSARTEKGILITPGKPLGRLPDEMVLVSPTSNALPDAAPREAWMHLAIYAARPEVNAICRGQPDWVAAAAAADITIQPLHGQGSFCGRTVPVHPDSRLARTSEQGWSVAESLGDADALVLHGNGALTVGPDVPTTVARLWVLDASARLNVLAASAGTPTPLPHSEQDQWRTTEKELLTRIWDHLIHD